MDGNRSNTRWIAAALASLALFAACAEIPGSEGSGGAGADAIAGGYDASAVVMRWGGGADGSAWTRVSRDAVETLGTGLTGMVPADIDSYCSGYRDAGADARRDFWVGLMSALARWESNFRPAESFEEDFSDSSGRPVVSRGLLQISQESANGYGCGITEASQLHDPATNLSCGVRILNRLVTRDGRIASDAAPWRGASAYWSPFRRPERRADMAGWTAAQPFCQ